MAHRTEAHLFISVIAYHLLISIEYQLSTCGDHRRWTTIRDILSTHWRNTVILTDEDETIHHIRVSGDIEPCHRDIYQKLNVTNPIKKTHHQVGRRV